MCTRYISPEALAIEQQWHVGRSSPWRGAQVFPRQSGAFLRPGPQGIDLVVGQFGLIPLFAKEAKLSYATQNARSEEVANKASFRQPWAKGQRCIIPARSFDEPCWETGRNVWHTFSRTDGLLWGLAGLWNTWTDRSTGEVLESYTMLTMNADEHPLMKRMHKPDPKLPPEAQDKRSVIAIEMDDVERWLLGSLDDAKELLRLTSEGAFQVQA